jgi:hypothetical protein
VEEGAPIFVRFLTQVASRFGIVVTQKAAALATRRRSRELRVHPAFSRRSSQPLCHATAGTTIRQRARPNGIRVGFWALKEGCAAATVGATMSANATRWRAMKLMPVPIGQELSSCAQSRANPQMRADCKNVGCPESTSRGGKRASGPQSILWM